MSTPADCPLAATLAGRLRAERDALTTRWLERIAARVALDPQRVFPTDDLLDHVPLLLDGIADYVADPARAVGADAPVLAKAMELGDLRHAQGFDAYELLKEYEILGGLLFTFLGDVVEAIDEPCSRRELLACTHRVFHAIALIQQATTVQFLRRGREQVREREARLRIFNRALSHELKNNLHAALGANATLELAWELAQDPAGAPATVAATAAAGPIPAAASTLTEIVGRNLRAMQGRLAGLLELTRLEGDTRQQRHVLLPQAAAEAARQLRAAAAEARVTVSLAPDVPTVEVHAAAVELCLANYLSNAIKYHDPTKTSRWVVVGGALREFGGGRSELVVTVRDNGRGVPPAARATLFERFTRAHTQQADAIEGTGLGLSLVRDAVESLGGRAWAEFPAEGGAVFAFSLPYRRATDRGAADHGASGDTEAAPERPADPRTERHPRG